MAPAAAAATADEAREFAERLGVATDIALAAGGAAPLLDAADGETLAATFDGVDLALGGRGAPAGAGGRLFVTTRRVVWLPAASGDAAAEAAGPFKGGLALRFPQVVMHAVSTDASAFARPCVYLQLDEGDGDGCGGDGGGAGFAGFGAVLGGSAATAAAGGSGGDDASGSGSGDDDAGSDDASDDGGALSAEVRLVPADAGAVEAIFSALCEGSALNPDPDNDGEGRALDD